MLKIQEFSGLTDAEARKMYNAPALIALLVAAADNKIDEQEISWAEKVVGYRHEVGNEILFNYYEVVDTYIHQDLEVLMAENKTTQVLMAELEISLEAMNAILAKLDKKFALALVKSWRSFAKQIAKASGGFLGFGSISEQEAQVMDLHMITL